MLKIQAVKQSSPAARAGLRRGDVVLSIGPDSVRDVIDFMFHSNEYSVEVRAKRRTGTFSVRLRRNGEGEFGLSFEPLKPKSCPNKCVFCFVDQLPRGLRPSLYVKDEDYRFSFLHGNYVTLTNLTSRDLQRIVTQRLSPLYVSVHSTEPRLRARLLGLRNPSDVLSKLESLRRGGIEVHAQVVLCPGVNDGAHLEKTVRDLAELFPGVKSVAVVPVGLTGHRRGLPRLRPVGCRDAARALDCLEALQAGFLRKLGTRFVFGADEMFLVAGRKVPATKKYEGFPQVENGVGLVRIFLTESGRLRGRIRRRTKGGRAAVLTGTLAEPVLAAALTGGGVRVVGVRNRFLGESVTVVGLLSGRDLLRAMSELAPGETAVVSEECLNPDGLFLDGMTPGELERTSGHKVIIEGLRHGKLRRGDSRPAERGEVHAFQ